MLARQQARTAAQILLAFFSHFLYAAVCVREECVCLCVCLCICVWLAAKNYVRYQFRVDTCQETRNATKHAHHISTFSSPQIFLPLYLSLSLSLSLSLCLSLRFWCSNEIQTPSENVIEKVKQRKERKGEEPPWSGSAALHIKVPRAVGSNYVACG